MKRSNLYSLFVLSFVHIISTAQIYVNQFAQGANNGTTWNNAYTLLETALSAASQGTQIWVATGNYTAPANSSFFLKEGVAVYGGFAGVESSLSQRDPSKYETILHGDGRNVVRTQFTVTDATILDGFTITGGDVPYNTSANYGGGGIRAEGSPQLRNLHIFSNSSYSLGGGIYLQESTSAITNVTVTQNNAQAYGGGIYCEASAPTFSNVEVSGNNATTDGGGIYHRDDYFTGSGFSKGAVYNTTITGNNAGQSGGGVYTKNCSAIYVNSSIHDNTAYYEGGGIYLNGQWQFADLFYNLLVANNTAGTGGGLYLNDANIGFVNMTLTNNYSNNSSTGGMYCKSSDAELKNSIVYGNRVAPHAPVVNNVAEDQFSSVSYDNCLVQDLGAYGIHGLPHFADSANGDYQLTKASDALNKGSSLHYTISVNVDLAGNPRVSGSEIDIGAFEFSGTVSGLSETVINAVSIYPQPAGDLLFTEVDKEYTYLISDLQGKALMSGRDQKPGTGINISALPEGTFILNLDAGEGLRRAKFIRMTVR